MYSTVNKTTIKVGQARATVIADSKSPIDGARITTLELVYPRYIHSELLTHRSFSRSASSSRATPISVLVAEARDPVFFDEIYVNKPGMQGTEPLDFTKVVAFRNDWVDLANYVADWVEEKSACYNIHKQTLNRVLEPFTRIRTLVTATDWDNFFKLRLDGAAQPEMRSLALAMRDAMAESTPVETNVHKPYAVSHDPDPVKCAVARCARVSYMRLDGRPNNAEDDVRLYEHLRASGHMSPFEHVAYAEAGHHANFTGWRSLRNIIGA